MKLIETSYFVKRPAQNSQAENTKRGKEEENSQQLLPLQSGDNLLPAVSKVSKKEVDKIARLSSDIQLKVLSLSKRFFLRADLS